MLLAVLYILLIPLYERACVGVHQNEACVGVRERERERETEREREKERPVAKKGAHVIELGMDRFLVYQDLLEHSGLRVEG